LPSFATDKIGLAISQMESVIDSFTEAFFLRA